MHPLRLCVFLLIAFAAVSGAARNAPPLPLALGGHHAAWLNGYLYVFGGRLGTADENGGAVRNDRLWVYTPEGHPHGGEAVGQWQALDAPFPETDTEGAALVAHAGRLWVLGGGTPHPHDRIHVFTPEDGKGPHGAWHQVRGQDAAPCGPASIDVCLRLPEPRRGAVAVSAIDRLYLIGGAIPDYGALGADPQPLASNAVLFLDTAENPLRWRLAPAMRHPRVGHSAAAAEGRLWVFDGRNEATDVIDDLESHAPGEYSWQRDPVVPAPTTDAAAFASGGCVYAVGGRTAAAFRYYDTVARAWGSTPAPEELQRIGATVVPGPDEGVFWMIGGAPSPGATPLADVTAFRPPPCGEARER